MSRGVFSSGKNSNAQCDRCGWDYPYLELSKESGTELLVCPTCNDGSYSIICHPQNYPPKDLGDAIALRNPRPDPDAGAQGISLFGITSNGFATEYVGTFILTPGENSYPVVQSSFFEYTVQGINASCVTGNCLLDIIVGGTPIEEDIAVSASSGNTALSGIMNSGDSLYVNVKSPSADCRSVKVDLAILRV